MKKYIICLLASTSILNATEFNSIVNDDARVPNLAVAPMTPREQAETIIAGQLNQISIATATFSLPEAKIIELAMKVANLSNQATDIIQQKLNQHTLESSMYDTRLLKLALSEPTLKKQATSFIEFKLGQYTYLHDTPTHGTVDAGIFKLARDIPSLSGLIEKLIKAKIGKYNKAVKTNASLCLPFDLPMILKSAMYNPLFSSQAIDIVEKEMARYEASPTPPDLRIIKLALNNQRAAVLGRASATEDREQSKKLKGLNEKAIDFIDNQLGQYIYTPRPVSTTSMYDSYIVKLATYHETLRPMAQRFISDELTRFTSMSTSSAAYLSTQNEEILRLAMNIPSISDQATNIIRTRLDAYGNPTMSNHEILRLALQAPALKNQATDIVRNKLGSLTTMTTAITTPDIEILELAMGITD